MFELTFLGDLYPGEYYQERLENTGGSNLLKTKGYSYSFEKLHHLIEGQDAIIANLETPLTDVTHSPFQGEKQYLHRGDINATPQLLKDYGINYVFIGNNHVMDYGVAGLEQTLVILNQHGISSFGAGFSMARSAQPIIFKFHETGIERNIIVVGGFEYRSKYDHKYKYYTSPSHMSECYTALGNDRPGVNGWTIKTSTEQLKMLKATHPGAWLIAYPHWGKNYEWKNNQQTAIAEAMIDAGADLIIGHGAHSLQEIDRYKGKWIVYSLGNSVFNSPGRYVQKGAMNASLVARLMFGIEKNGQTVVQTRLYPILSDNRITGYQPRPLGYEEIAGIREALLSLNTTRTDMSKALRIEKDSIGFCFALPPV